NYFFSSRRRHTRSKRDWSSDVCSSDLFAYTAAYSGVRTVLTDNPENPPNLQSLHLIEWSWHQGMGALADFACELALGPILLLTRSEERRVGRECQVVVERLG